MLSLFRSFCVTMQMLSDRGYDVGEHMLNIDKDYQKFVDIYSDDVENARKMLNLKFHKTEKSKKTNIMTFWYPTLGKSDLQEIYETLVEQNINHAIVVHLNKVTPYTIPVIKSLKTLKYNIEPFMESELQFNIMHHEDVPKHIICSKKKKDAVLSTYSVTPDKLPRILSTDPVCRYLGAAKGQLIKIIRPSDSVAEININGETKILFDVTYRIVV